jgi:hypothetical protein
MAVANTNIARDLPRPGDYLCSDRALYQVERVLDDHAVIDDCKDRGADRGHDRWAAGAATGPHRF